MVLEWTKDGGHPEISLLQVPGGVIVHIRTIAIEGVRSHMSTTAVFVPNVTCGFSPYGLEMYSDRKDGE